MGIRAQIVSPPPIRCHSIPPRKLLQLAGEDVSNKEDVEQQLQLRKDANGASKEVRLRFSVPRGLVSTRCFDGGQDRMTVPTSWESLDSHSVVGAENDEETPKDIVVDWMADWICKMEVIRPELLRAVPVACALRGLRRPTAKAKDHPPPTAAPTASEKLLGAELTASYIGVILRSAVQARPSRAFSLAVL
eukprot:g15954.t1